MKLLKVLCVIALVLVMSTIAYAETQSVKVSGDITVRSLARHNYDLDSNDAMQLAATMATANTGSQSTDWATHLMSTTELQVDADMTDNVSGVVRLVNQRVWGSMPQSAGDETGIVGAPYNDQVAANAINPTGTETFDVLVDLAYIELKEFLYSPLTLKIGRQDLWFGKGFIIGAQLQNPQNALLAPEYTAMTSFDAVRGTLDYDPWTIDMVYSKINENFRRADDDVNLWGVNVGYVFDSYNAEAEGYWWFRNERYVGTTGGATGTPSVNTKANSNDVHVYGLRGSFDPIEDWTVALEGAYQAGEYVGIANQIDQRDRSAWAVDAAVECRYWQDDFAWRPTLGLEYIFYSGEENLGNLTAANNGTYQGWDPMFRGKFDTAIREFQNVYYITNTAGSPSSTNQHQLIVSGTLEPTDSLTLDMQYAYFWLAEDYASFTGNAAQNTDSNIGSETDFNLTWDYTEDVTFGLLTAFFFPGDYYSSGMDDIATDIVGSVKLSF